MWVVIELGSFFQNYRRYVRSYDPSAMHKGLTGGATPASDCNPFSYQQQPNGSGLPVNPCGAIAYSYFNDTYTLAVTPPAAKVGASRSRCRWTTAASPGPATPTTCTAT